MTGVVRFGVGEAVPWFKAHSLNGPKDYSFDIAAGRPVLLLFFGTAGHPMAKPAIDAVKAKRDWFNDVDASFYGVTIDPADVAEGRIALDLPGIRYFLDYDGAVSRMFGAVNDSGDYHAFWLLLDRSLRVVAQYTLSNHEGAMAGLRTLIDAGAAPDWAPVVMVPNVLEPEFCRMLIGLYEANGGTESGVMRDIGGNTKLVLDPAFKVRRDYNIASPPVVEQLMARLRRRLMPMIKRSFQFDATRVERLLIGCYDEADGGHFRAHRDDTVAGTAHRRFAVTINLNTEEYEGGDLRFPEFGSRTYRAPTGGAVVFSCSLMHQAMPVTRGRRFALLPFLYDEAAEEVRQRNMHLIDLDPLRLNSQAPRAN